MTDNNIDLTTDFYLEPEVDSFLSTKVDILDLNRIDNIKEDKANKVSTWSNVTNHDHYPSEKLVKDSLDQLQESVVSNAISKDEFLSLFDVDFDIELGQALLNDENIYIDVFLKERSDD